MEPGRIAIIAVSLAVVAGTGWAAAELGRQEEPVPVRPIVVSTDQLAAGFGGRRSQGDEPAGGGEPGGGAEQARQDREPSPGVGAESVPIPPPPPAGEDDEGGGDDDGDE